MKIKDGFTKRKIAGSNVVVPVGKKSKDFEGIITLNDTASFFWDCFIEDRTEAEVEEMVLQKFDVEREKAKSDLTKFINILKENNLFE